MDTRSLQAFKKTYETGSVTKAAAELYISPQGLSKTVARLEAELGVTLFERSHHGMAPTSHADALYPKVRELAALLSSIEEDAACRAERAELRVASVSGNLSYLGLEFVEDFRRAHPDIALHVEEGNDKRINELMMSGRADVGFMAGPVDHTRYEASLFGSHRHVLVVNEQDELAQRNGVTYADLDGRVVALMGRDFSPYSNNMNRLARAKARPADVVEVAEIDTAMLFVQRNQAVCISTDYAAFMNPWPNTRVIPFTGESDTWDVYLVTRRDFPSSGNATRFAGFARAWLAEHEKDLFHWPEGDADGTAGPRRPQDNPGGSSSTPR